MEIYDTWASRVVDAEVPAGLKGLVLYNWACFDATHGRVERALPSLRQALELHPGYREFAETDPDLAALRPFSFE